MNFIWFPIVYVLLMIAINYLGVILGSFYYDEVNIINLFGLNEFSLILGSLLRTVMVLFLFGIIFVQSYPYTEKGYKIKNIRNKKNLTSGSKCWNIFNSVYCYKNFRNMMRGKRMENTNNKYMKYMIIIFIIGLLMVVYIFWMILFPLTTVRIQPEWFLT